MYYRLAPSGDEIGFACKRVEYALSKATDALPMRKAAVEKFRNLPEFKALKDNEAFLVDLKNICDRAVQSSLAFGAYALLNHWLLSKEDQDAREAVIDAELNKMFKPALHDFFGSEYELILAGIRSCLKVEPNSQLRHTASAVAWLLKGSAVNEHMTKMQSMVAEADKKQAGQMLRKKEVVKYIHQLEEFWPACQKVTSSNLVDEFKFHLFTLGFSLIDDGTVFCKAIASLSKSPSGLNFFRALFERTDLDPVKNLNANTLDYEWAVQCLIEGAALHDTLIKRLEAEALAKGLHGKALDEWVDGAALQDDSGKALIERLRAEAVARWCDSECLAWDETISANRKGRVTLSESLRAEAALALIVLDNRTIMSDNAMRTSLPKQSGRTTTVLTGPAGGRGRGGGGKSGGEAPRSTDKASQGPGVIAQADPVALEMQRAGWSVDQYVQWIEGPADRRIEETAPTTATATKANSTLSRAMQRSKDATKQYNKNAKVVADAAADRGAMKDVAKSLVLSRPLALKEEEAARIIDQGLRKTTQYLIDELDDLKVMAEQHFAQADIDELKRLRGLLADLHKSETALDEAKARAIFEAAWDEALKARQTIKTQERDERLHNDFEAALWRALGNEGLSVGKEMGGQILMKSPDPMHYWTRILAEFHDRHLPWNKTVLKGGIEQRLGADEALALYVTASSRTEGAAFCVSVHLWRRRRDHDAEPTATGEFKMNKLAWYDTHIPCAVLHVHGTPAKASVPAQAQARAQAQPH